MKKYASEMSCFLISERENRVYLEIELSKPFHMKSPVETDGTFWKFWTFFWKNVE